MIENPISSSSLYSQCSTLNYTQAAMMGLTGSHGSLQDSQQLGYSSHGNIPNIILTGMVPAARDTVLVVPVLYCECMHQLDLFSRVWVPTCLSPC